MSVMIRTTLALLLTTAVVMAQDSPLVALAKRTNRKASKTPVITNETVARSKGRVSLPAGDTQAVAAALPALPTPTAAPTAQEETPRQPARAATAAATAPYTAPATTTVRNITPESTARTIMPETARTIEPATTARQITPQSTVPTVQPASTARNIQPQTSNPPQ